MSKKRKTQFWDFIFKIIGKISLKHDLINSLNRDFK